MCANLFSKPKVQAPVVEKVAPAPQAVSQPETAAIKNRAREDKRQRALANEEVGRTSLSSRIVPNNAPSMLGQAQSGKKTELG